MKENTSSNNIVNAIEAIQIEVEQVEPKEKVDHTFKIEINGEKRTYKSKSDYIRKRNADGLKTKEIAKESSIRYQMVRNILVNAENSKIVAASKEAK